MLVCSQYKRFIELLFEHGRQDAFKGKYAAALSTSIHFYDNTAMNYIQAVSDDLGMNFIEGITAHMEDLRKDDFRRSYDAVFTEWIRKTESGSPTDRAFSPVTTSDFTYDPAAGKDPEKVAGPGTGGFAGLKVTIVGDLEGEGSSVRKMALRASSAVEAASGSAPEIIDLSQLKFGPCIGCLKCGFDNHCVYEGKDDYIGLHRGTVLESDVIIFAGAFHDRYLSSRWQRYLDRSFNYTHQPRLGGKKIIFLISGPLAQNPVVRQMLTAYGEVLGSGPASFVTDESGDSAAVSSLIDGAVYSALNRAAGKVSVPSSFLGLAGMKIFRDDVRGHLRFVFQADHRYYRKHGIYDFPQKKVFRMIGISAGVLMTKIPPLRRIIRGQLRQGMIPPFTKVLDKTVPLQTDKTAENEYNKAV